MGIVKVFNVVDQAGSGADFQIIGAFLLSLDGGMTAVSLGSVTSTVVKGEVTVTEGSPLVVHLERGEFLLVLGSGVIQGQGTLKIVRLLIYKDDGSCLRPFSGYWGAIEEEGWDFWRFPGIEDVLALYSSLTGDVSVPAEVVELPGGNKKLQ